MTMNGATADAGRSSQHEFDGQPPNFSQTSEILNGVSGQGSAITSDHPNSEAMLQVSIQGMFDGRVGQSGNGLRNTPEEERKLVADDGDGNGDGGMDIS